MPEDGTNITTVALIALLITSYLTWSLPRRFAVCPLLVITCLMPLGQKLNLFGFNLHLFRILLLVGIVRAVLKGELAQVKWTRLDALLLCWGGVSILFGTLSKPSVGLFVNRVGRA